MPLIDYRWLKGRTPCVLGYESSMTSAVMVPLAWRQGQLAVLFEERAHSLNRQPGEICFPGGRVDPCDPEPVQAAVRETCEELGLCAGDLEVIAPLDILVTPYNLIVHPFLCEVNAAAELRPNPDEVADVFWVPLEFFHATPPLTWELRVHMHPAEDFPFDLIPSGRDYDWKVGVYQVHFYLYEGRVIWGMTARLVHHLLRLLTTTACPLEERATPPGPPY
ncbi:MAG: CoA pyrophosphatase [Syntrophomonadaceae bacterium]|nr:CoA pyrophosphatase [Syntrophomonadaceae bacterium]MDH7496848.1 CoA pyrophosphatase [Syntrophomonadaceae bacterium]